MKRINVLLMLMLMMSLVAGCQTDKTTNIFSRDELSVEEKNILNRVGFIEDLEIYDYEIDETFKSMSTWLEIYKDGELISEQSRMTSQINSRKGDIAIVVKKDQPYIWKLSHKDGRSSSSYYFETEEDYVDYEIYSVSSGVLNEPVSIESDGEIVLKTYLFEDADVVSIYSNQYYVDYPEFIKEYDYVFLLKCQFSTKSADELNPVAE